MVKRKILYSMIKLIKEQNNNKQEKMWECYFQMRYQTLIEKNFFQEKYPNFLTVILSALTNEIQSIKIN